VIWTICRYGFLQRLADFQNQPDGSHSFLNGGAPTMNMLQHAGVYMPFVGAGLGPEMGQDMNLGKHEAPSWDPNTRMGLTELPDKSQVSLLNFFWHGMGY
jgi:hypothetical protein